MSSQHKDPSDKSDLGYALAGARFICCIKSYFMQHMLHGSAAIEVLAPQ